MFGVPFETHNVLYIIVSIGIAKVVTVIFIMVTSSNRNIFSVIGLLCGNLTVIPHKGQWRRALMFSLICAWTYGWVNSRGAGDLRRHRAHYDVTVMLSEHWNIHQHQPVDNIVFVGDEVDEYHWSFQNSFFFMKYKIPHYVSTNSVYHW